MAWHTRTQTLTLFRRGILVILFLVTHWTYVECISISILVICHLKENWMGFNTNTVINVMLHMHNQLLYKSSYNFGYHVHRCSWRDRKYIKKIKLYHFCHNHNTDWVTHTLWGESNHNNIHLVTLVLCGVLLKLFTSDDPCFHII